MITIEIANYVAMRHNNVGNAIALQNMSPPWTRDRMPLNSHTLPTTSCQEFCLALKAARERKGITLDEIAETTKIPASLFAELERNDLRRWPQGLFRRSFFRDYARMIGVPVTEACAEFVRLFLDEEPAEPATPVDAMTGARRHPLLEALAQGRAAIAAAWQRGTEAISRLQARADDPAEQADEPEVRPWVSDARRVSSAPPPRIRVRIKLPR